MEYYDLRADPGPGAPDRGPSPRPPMSRSRALGRAEMVFQELVDSDPNGRLAHQGVYFLGLIAMERRRWEKAIARFEELLAEYKNSRFRADQFSEGTVFEFLADLVALQRAISWFEDDKTPAERDQFVQGITAAVVSR